MRDVAMCSMRCTIQRTLRYAAASTAVAKDLLHFYKTSEKRSIALPRLSLALTAAACRHPHHGQQCPRSQMPSLSQVDAARAQ
jgi:hypothetical protein